MLSACGATDLVFVGATMVVLAKSSRRYERLLPTRSGHLLSMKGWVIHLDLLSKARKTVITQP